MSCYDLSSGALKCKRVGHAVLRGDLATLTCLAASGRSCGGLFVGDTAGKVSLVQNVPGLPARQLTPADFRVVHKAHKDWITQARHYQISALGPHAPQHPR